MFFLIDKDKNTIVLTTSEGNELAKFIYKHGKIGEIVPHKTRKDLDAEITKFLKGEVNDI